MTPKDIQKIVEQIGTPVYVYEQKALEANIGRIQNSLEKYGLKERIRPYVAYFANSNPHLFKIVVAKGFGIVMQTQEEFAQLKGNGLSDDVILSPSFLSDAEIDYWQKQKVKVNLASLEEVKYFVSKYNASPCFRVDLTSDASQRTAIKSYQLLELKAFLTSKKIVPESFHVYIGTGSSLKKAKNNFRKVLGLHKKFFPETKNINLGGGFGYSYDETDEKKKHFDWDSYFHFVADMVKKYKLPDDVQFIIEPGRDIFVDAGTLLIRINRIVKLRGRINLGTDGSYVYLPSATTRVRKHKTLFYDKSCVLRTDRSAYGSLSGATTLSSDYVYPGNIKIPENIQNGDILEIKDVGAYGATQHMEFLNKRPCPEVLIDSDDQISLITKRGPDDDKIRHLLNRPEALC